MLGHENRKWFRQILGQGFEGHHPPHNKAFTLRHGREESLQVGRALGCRKHLLWGEGGATTPLYRERSSAKGGGLCGSGSVAF